VLQIRARRVIISQVEDQQSPLALRSGVSVGFLSIADIKL
jgi:hypothetical protein